MENDTEVKDDGGGTAPEAAKERTDVDKDLDVKPHAAEDREATDVAADPVGPPADDADDGSALTDFPACLSGDWNVGKSPIVVTSEEWSRRRSMKPATVVINEVELDFDADVRVIPYASVPASRKLSSREMVEKLERERRTTFGYGRPNRTASPRRKGTL